MSETLKIYASDSTILKKDYPDTNFNGATTYDYDSSTLMLKFSPTTAQLDQLDGQEIEAVKLGVYVITATSSTEAKADVFALTEEYDFSTITYDDTRDLHVGAEIGSFTGTKGAGWKTLIYEKGVKPSQLKKLLSYGMAIPWMWPDMQTAKGANPPYLEIAFTPATPRYTLNTNRRYMATEVDNVIWATPHFENVYGEIPALASQTFLWRASSTDATHEISFDVGTRQVDIPAGTFPENTSIQIAAIGTTTAGATSEATWESQSTSAVLMSSISPASGGIAPKNAPALLTWTPQQWESDYYSLAHYVPVQQSSATITYRTTGTTATTSISITDGTTSYTIPAGTFTADSIDWMVTATTVGGTTVSSDWATISTVDTTPSSKPVSPSGISIDATITNRFSWQHIISTGTAQTAADLQYSTDGSTWTDLASVTGSDQFYDVQADTFSAGTKFWHVRTYNSDSVAGEWSTAAQFVAIASPSTPAITVQSLTGRPSISWETSEQQAYQVKLSTGYESGTTYGTTQAWTAPYYLADGTYTVSVRVQNEYGLWSEWGTAALPVTHTAGDTITLTVAAEDAAAALTWTTSGSYDFYIVERNGDPISKTTGKSYTDALATGETTYRIVGGYDASTNYTASDEVTETIKPGTNYLYVIATGEWIEMRTSETQLRQNTATRSVGLTTVHLAGLSYPVEELSGTADMTLTVTVAWPHSEAAKAKALEAAVGKLVCLKDTFGNQVIGTLATLECTYDKTMLRYAFTIQHTDYSEAVTL